MDQLAGKWIGPMPLKESITSFLPLPGEVLLSKPDFDNQIFADAEDEMDERDLCNSYIDIFRKTAATPGFNFVNTSQSATRDAKTGLMTQPGISCYKNASDVDNDSTTYEKTELIIECGTTEVDPFDDNPEEDKTNRFLSNLNIVLHRTHCFIVWIASPHARIIRFDRSGTIVSEKFNCHKNGNILLDFLWWFSQSDGASRGLDGTITRASPTEAKMARTALLKWAPADKHSVFKVQVPDPDPDGDKKRTRPFFVWAPLEDRRVVTGRATRGYPAWDPKGDGGKGRVVFLKDSWRSCEPGMEKEVDILKELRDKKCRNVPELVCGDDLPDQTTVTQKYASALWNIGAPPNKFVQRVHTRFVEKDVGTHLTSATGIGLPMHSKKFLRIVFDAFIAHYDAYVLCGILHRDISAGNILMNEEGRGFLNDWDLSKYIGNTVARQIFRSGTWQFMSSTLLLDPGKLNTLQDDFESVFWLVTFHILCYMTHNQPEDLAETMSAIFDSQDPAPLGKTPRGGHTKYSVLMGHSNLRDDFEVIGNKPLTAFYRKTLSQLNDWHVYISSYENAVKKYTEDNNVSKEVARTKVLPDTAHLALHTHQPMMQLFEQAFADDSQWPNPISDFFVDRLATPEKRRREEESEENEGSLAEESDGSTGSGSSSASERPKNS